MDTNAVGRGRGTSPAPTHRSAVSDSTLAVPEQAVRQFPRAGRARSRKDDPEFQTNADRRDHEDLPSPGRDQNSGEAGHGAAPFGYSPTGELTVPHSQTSEDRSEVSSLGRDEKALAGLLGNRAYGDGDEDRDDRPHVVRTA